MSNNYICPVCGSIFSRPGNAKYCSRECYLESIRRSSESYRIDKYEKSASVAIGALDEWHREHLKLLLQKEKDA